MQIHGLSQPTEWGPGMGQEPVPTALGFYACSHRRTSLCGDHIAFNAQSWTSGYSSNTCPIGQSFRDHVPVTSLALQLTFLPLLLTSLQPSALWLHQSSQISPDQLLMGSLSYLMVT